MKKSIQNCALVILLLCCPINFIKASSTPDNSWAAETFYISEASINIYDEPSLLGKVLGNFFYLEKILIVKENNSSDKFGWKKVVYPQKGYVEEKHLLTPQQKNERTKKFGYEEDEKNFWQWEYKYCGEKLVFVKELPVFQSLNVGIIEKEEKVLIVLDGKNNNKVWMKILYPLEGYISSENVLIEPSYFVLTLAGVYGASEIPYEKNLTNYKKPYGGFLEISKTGWDFSFRMSYNHSESNLAKYILKSQILSLQVRYTYLSLFNNHLTTYALAGGSYWFSSFQNTKYESLSSYFPLEKDKGIGYVIGGGILYQFFNFFIELQYNYFGSREAVFGKAPAAGEFKNQYKLYPGTSQADVMLGYRFVFK